MSADHGTILVLPGGGYRVHAPHEAEPIADWLSALGWQTRIVRYPLETAHPAPLDAVRDAVVAARAAGATRVGVIGFSAGGHLAGHAALAPDSTVAERPDFAVLGYPVVSMLERPHPGSRAVIAPDDHVAEAVSLERLVTPAAPPMFVWHTAEDAVVPVAHTYLLGRALATAGVPHEVHVFRGEVHGIGLGAATEAEAWPELCAAWLARRFGD